MTGFSEATRVTVAERAGWQCEIAKTCGGYGVLGPHHHRRPRGMGGTSDPKSNTAANALAACRDCHAHVESHLDEARVEGWHVPHGTDPATVKVLYRDRGYVLLDENGGVTPYVADHPDPRDTQQGDAA